MLTAMVLTSFLAASVLTTTPDATMAREVDVIEALERVETLWLEGKFHDTAEAAAGALELIQISACPLRADAGIVAFIGAVSGHGHSEGWPGGYLFWVANEIHQQFGNLPNGAAELAEAFDSGPGQSVTTDLLFIRSPYRRSDLQSNCADPILDPDILSASPEDADHVYVAFQFPGRPGSFHRSPNRVAYAYPKHEGEALGARVIELDDWHDAGGPIEVRVFSPCAIYPIRSVLYAEVCRDRMIPHP